MNVSGRQHNVDIAVCNCESIAATMMRYKIWPSTPCEPRVAFHMDFMETLRAFMMESQVSVTGFWRACLANDRYFGRFGDVGFIIYYYNIILGEPYQYSLL